MFLCNWPNCSRKWFFLHRRITLNGFDLVLYRYGDHNTSSSTSTMIKMEGRCPDIPFYGLADLLELLGRMDEQRGGGLFGVGFADFYSEMRPNHCRLHVPIRINLCVSRSNFLCNSNTVFEYGKFSECVRAVPVPGIENSDAKGFLSNSCLGKKNFRACLHGARFNS